MIDRKDKEAVKAILEACDRAGFDTPEKIAAAGRIVNAVEATKTGAAIQQVAAQPQTTPAATPAAAPTTPPADSIPAAQAAGQKAASIGKSFWKGFTGG